MPIAEGMLQTLSPEIAAKTASLTHYFAENAKNTRRFLKMLHPTLVLETVHISEIDKHSGADIDLFRKWVRDGHDIGIISDSGCPAVADPGAILVNIAHQISAKVVPLTGPSSILLALMASGLGGQSFAFIGYLPVKDPNRSKRIKELEIVSQRDRQTQIFIETPYRNNSLLAEILKQSYHYTKLSIAQDITGEKEFIKTLSIADWKKNIPVLEKLPTVFSLLTP